MSSNPRVQVTNMSFDQVHPNAASRSSIHSRAEYKQLLTDHIRLLEQHAQLLSQAAAHFQVQSGAATTQSNGLNVMSNRAQQALQDARLAAASIHQMSSASSTAQAQPQPKTPRKRSSEDPPDLPYLGSAKRRRMDGLVECSSQLPRPKEGAADVDVERDDKHDQRQRGDTEYEDLSAKVEARLAAAERRRQENSGLLHKKAVKRKRSDDHVMEEASGADAARGIRSSRDYARPRKKACGWMRKATSTAPGIENEEAAFARGARTYTRQEERHE